MNGYEDFKKDILGLTKIDLNSYKEKQMKRRIDTLIGKNGISSYKDYVALIKKNEEKFEQFVNFLTINVSEFYRNPEQWEILDKNVFPALIKRCMFHRRRAVFSGYGIVKTRTDQSDSHHSDRY